uniref:Uncharacterized protein n=1 Tax=Eutreptiella gymnastica TaxID=73025 RepID=A0A7S1IAZ5_9EUGL|mmetsp:Transcript_143773/g.250964  ORF Transcript_143773/g.250964 Transcript_143773/m.250964 type:complete len:757 (+) Transcript_143773:36-2306(+)
MSDDPEKAVASRESMAPTLNGIKGAEFISVFPSNEANVWHLAMQAAHTAKVTIMRLVHHGEQKWEWKECHTWMEQGISSRAMFVFEWQSKAYVYMLLGDGAHFRIETIKTPGMELLPHKVATVDGAYAIANAHTEADFDGVYSTAALFHWQSCPHVLLYSKAKGRWVCQALDLLASEDSSASEGPPKATGHWQTGWTHITPRVVPLLSDTPLREFICYNRDTGAMAVESLTIEGQSPTLDTPQLLPGPPGGALVTLAAKGKTDFWVYHPKHPQSSPGQQPPSANQAEPPTAASPSGWASSPRESQDDITKAMPPQPEEDTTPAGRLQRKLQLSGQPWSHVLQLPMDPGAGDETLTACYDRVTGRLWFAALSDSSEEVVQAAAEAADSSPEGAVPPSGPIPTPPEGEGIGPRRRQYSITSSASTDLPPGSLENTTVRAFYQDSRPCYPVSPGRSAAEKRRLRTELEESLLAKGLTEADLRDRELTPYEDGLQCVLAEMRGDRPHQKDAIDRAALELLRSPRPPKELKSGASLPFLDTSPGPTFLPSPPPIRVKEDPKYKDLPPPKWKPAGPTVSSWRDRLQQTVDSRISSMASRRTTKVLDKENLDKVLARLTNWQQEHDKRADLIARTVADEDKLRPRRVLSAAEMEKQVAKLYSDEMKRQHNAAEVELKKLQSPRLPIRKLTTEEMEDQLARFYHQPREQKKIKNERTRATLLKPEYKKVLTRAEVENVVSRMAEEDAKSAQKMQALWEEYNPKR